jgi:hypothetical protein
MKDPKPTTRAGKPSAAPAGKAGAGASETGQSSSLSTKPAAGGKAAAAAAASNGRAQRERPVNGNKAVRTHSEEDADTVSHGTIQKYQQLMVLQRQIFKSQLIEMHQLKRKEEAREEARKHKVVAVPPPPPAEPAAAAPAELAAPPAEVVAAPAEAAVPAELAAPAGAPVEPAQLPFGTAGHLAPTREVTDDEGGEGGAKRQKLDNAGM